MLDAKRHPQVAMFCPARRGRRGDGCLLLGIANSRRQNARQVEPPTAPTLQHRAHHGHATGYAGREHAASG
ncbi:MAG: hypothetical protein M3315_16025 [Actinomycetota bacterium]|nr:hypothetical protein [Actinomycetota bacterium]